MLIVDNPVCVSVDEILLVPIDGDLVVLDRRRGALVIDAAPGRQRPPLGAAVQTLPPTLKDTEAAEPVLPLVVDRVALVKNIHETEGDGVTG